MKVEALLVAALVPSVCIAQLSATGNQGGSELPTPAELSMAWSRDIGADLAKKGATPGRIYSYKDKVLFYQLGADGALAKKPVQIPKEWLFSVPEYSMQPAASPNVISGLQSPQASAVVGGSAKAWQDVLVAQSELLRMLSSAVQELRKEIADFQSSSKANSEEMRKKVAQAEERLKALEARPGEKK